MDTPAPLLDLRQTTNHPLSLRYSEVHDHAVLEGVFAHGRVQPSLSLAGNTPFVNAARRALRHGLDRPDTLEQMMAVLRGYYDLVRPGDAATWLGVPKVRGLQDQPPWAAVFPWRARTVASYRQAYEYAAIAENQAVGREAGIEDGWLFCGPVSKEKIRIEAERIFYVLTSIQQSGYSRQDGPDGDVRATALVNERQEWRWLITAGNHRASAAAALGMPSIPVRVNLVISRADAPYWNHVVDGLYSLDDALVVFDNFFDARPVGSTCAWLDLQSAC